MALPLSDYLQPALRNTRQSNTKNTYIQCHTRINSFKFSYMPRTIKDWNILPSNIKTTEDNDTFKELITAYYKDKDKNVMD